MSKSTRSLFDRSLQAERKLLSSSAIRALAEERWNISRPLLDWPLLILFVLAMTALFAPLGSSSLPIPNLDSIASETIRADRNLEVLDPEETILRKKQAIDSVRPQFVYDPELLFEIRNRAVTAIENVALRKNQDKLNVPQRIVAFEAELGLPVNSGVFKLSLIQI